MRKLLLWVAMAIAVAPLAAHAQSHHKLNPNALYQGYYSGAPVPDDVATQTQMNAVSATANAAAPRNAPAFTGMESHTTHLTASNTEANITVTTTALGSGTNGPGTAQNSLYLNAQKDNWFVYPTTAVTGEIDPLQILGRQGGANSDMSGMLINVQDTGTGFLSATEFASTIVDNNPSDPSYNTILQGIDLQEGALDGLTGGYEGVVYNKVNGAGGNAIQIQNTGSNASWTYWLDAVKAGVGALWTVDSSGNEVIQTINAQTSITSPSITTASAAITGGTVVGTAISGGSIAGSTAFPNPIVLGTINGPSGVASVTETNAGCYHIPGGGTNFPTVTAAAPTSSGSTATLAVASVNATCLASGSNIVTGGSGYSVNDVLTIVGGTFTTASRITVATVDGNGAILTYTATTAGVYTSLPTEPVSVTGGTGTGATLQNLGYAPGTFTVVSAGAGYTAPPAISFANTTYATLYTGTPRGTSALGPSGAVVVGPTGTTLGTSGASGTPVTSVGTFIDGSGIRVAMTGSAYTVPANTGLVRLTQSSTIASQTVTLPSALGDGQSIQFVNYTGAITALTFSPTVTGWTNGSPFAASTVFKIRWDATAGVWYLESGIAPSSPTYSSISVTGAATVGGITGGAASATASPGAGAGTGGTAAVSGNSLSGVVTVVAGTSPSASSTIATITGAGSFTANPRCVFAPAGANAGASGIYVTSSFSAGTLTLSFLDGATALTASGTYYWDYWCP